MISRRIFVGAGLAAPFVSKMAFAADGTGITASEIKLGQTTAYSGPVSGAGSFKRVQVAYFNYLNASGGINGRKVNLISLDDAYSPPKTVEATRKLVEQDEVCAMFNSFGTPTQAAVQRYLNIKKVPQLFVSSGAARFNDPKNSPWTTPAIPDIHKVGVMYAQYVTSKVPNAKIAVLFQNDDFGKDSLKGVKDGLGPEHSKALISEVSYDVTQPTIDSQIVTLKASGANAFINLSTGRFTVQSIKRMREINWQPLHVVHGSFGTIFETFRPVGLDICKGIYSSAFVKDPGDPQWDTDPSFMAYFEFMKAHVPDMEPRNRSGLSSYVIALVMADVIKQAGQKLSREALLEAALSITNPDGSGFLMPGVTMKTTQDERSLFSKEVMVQFDGRSWRNTQ